MPSTLANVTTFGEAERFLGDRDSRKVAHNTYVHRIDGETIAVRYHATDIVTYHHIPNSGSEFTVNTGGHRTYTTKERLNLFTPHGYVFFQKNWEWFINVGGHASGETFDYADGDRWDASAHQTLIDYRRAA